MDQAFNNFPKKYNTLISGVLNSSKNKSQRRKATYRLVGKTVNLPHLDNKVESSMKFITLLCAAIIKVDLLSGCVGMVADSMARSMSTDKQYDEMAKDLPRLADGSERLYIYRTAASTKYSLV